jgi:flagellar biosynthetic protein FliR
VEFMLARMMGFFLVLVRTSAFFLVGPIWGARIIPTQFRVAIVLILSGFFAWMSPGRFDHLTVSMVEVVVLLTLEAVYGLAFGLIAILMFSVVKIAARIVEHQMGFVMAQTFDPLSGGDAQPLSLLMEMLFILMFFSANGHHMFVLIMGKSFEVFPVGTPPDIGLLLESVVGAGSSMFMASLRLSAPLLCTFFLLLSTLAIFARIMPDMDILFLSMPLRAGLGLLFCSMAMPFLLEFVTEFSDWMGKLLPM